MESCSLMKYEINFPAGEFDLFIDVGLSHNAPTSAEFLTHNPTSFVIGIEPNPNSCERVRALELGERFHLIEAGVANSTKETMAFNIIAQSDGDITDQGTSSFHKPSELFENDGYEVLETKDVPVVALETILDQVPWERVNNGVFRMKSDTQGFEDEVVASLGKYMSRLELLQIESSTAGQYDNASHHDKVCELLEPYMVQVKNDGWNAWFTKKK